MPTESPCKVCGSFKKPTVLRMFKKTVTAFYCPHCDRVCKNRLACAKCRKMIGWDGCGSKGPK